MKTKKSVPVIMSKKNDNIIHVETKTIMPHYNTFACGYGKFEDKTKKRSNRKNKTRKMIREAGY